MKQKEWNLIGMPKLKENLILTKHGLILPMQFFLCQKSIFLDEGLPLDVIIKYCSIQIFGERYANATDSAQNT